MIAIIVIAVVVIIVEGVVIIINSNRTLVVVAVVKVVAIVAVVPFSCHMANRSSILMCTPIYLLKKPNFSFYFFSTTPGH